MTKNMIIKLNICNDNHAQLAIYEIEHIEESELGEHAFIAENKGKLIIS